MKTGRASRTAAVIALSAVLDETESASSGTSQRGVRGIAGQHPVDDAGVRARSLPALCLMQSSLGLRVLGRGVRIWPVRALLKLIERWRMPGIGAHYRARKAWIAARTRAAIRNGAQQLIVLGAGYDALAWRCSEEQPGLLAVELDHPATQAIKQRALGGLQRGCRLQLEAFDFQQEDLCSAFAGCGLQRSASTIVVAEGLSMYLPIDTVRWHLAELAAYFKGPLVLLATALRSEDDHQPLPAWRSRWLSRWLARAAEPFRWASSCAEIRTELTNADWHIVEIGDVDDLAAPTQPCPGEIILHATRGPV